MNIFKSVKGEYRNIYKTPKLLIAVIAILFIPFLYGGTFLWAFWNPYGNVDKLPVAIVNLDKGADYNNKKLTVGKDLAEKLKEKKTFDFHFITEKEANRGLQNQKYYMKIEIPEDFSKNATTLQDDQPKSLNLIYTPNEGENYLSTKIGDSAIEKIKNEVSAAVTKTYAESMFDNLKDVAGGLDKASKGAGKLNNGLSDAKKGAGNLHEGIGTAKTGADQLNSGAGSVHSGAAEIRKNLETLAQKSVTFSNGIQSAAEGSNQLTKGLEQFSTGIGKMKEGQSRLLEGAQKSEAGTKALSNGLDQSLIGIGAIQEKLPQFTQGASSLADGANTLASSLNQLQYGASQTKQGSAAVNDNLEKVISNVDTMKNAAADPAQKASLEKLEQTLNAILQGSQGVETGIGKISDGAGTIAEKGKAFNTGAASLQEGQKALSSGFDQLAGGQEKLSEGAKNLESGQGQLVAGLTEFGNKIGTAQSSADKLLTGSSNLSAGLNQLAGGSVQLKDGTSKLSEGSKQLEAGTSKLSSGSSSLVNGIDKLSNGSSDLEKGVGKLENGSKDLKNQLKNGADDAGSVKANNKVYDMFAQPVKVDEQKVNPVKNYGTGFTPYFLSLSLFVGALMFSVIFPMRKPAVSPNSGASWFFGKVGVIFTVGILQALLVDAALILMLGLEVKSLGYFIMLSVFASWTFLSMVFFLVAAFDNPGRFIAILILILQLTSSAGTYPIELVPGILQHANAFLPMTYSIAGFRAIVASGDYAFMWHNIGSLSIFLVVALAAAFAYFQLSFRKSGKIHTGREAAE
ncbi:putative membrane protein [Bacillus sp. OV322]|uniref:YhgE/Pip domain-containing protein n=1 Tax=Bacillus sp. OV322 TaxID=1882764 RepID=UPI0008EC77E8|nr:YhgE/Pip domain-containing protein [Bacillus sp. OV322]SFC80166.1 putative membrane protein [Bacillus sp. OV322]